MLGVVPFIGILPVAIWLLGVFPMDLARACAGLMLLVALGSRKRAWELTPRFGGAALVLLGLVPIAIAFHQAARVVAGLQGLDFAIFAQAAHSIATTGVPTTTLLFDQPVNFLTHHFAPVLYFPGLVTWLGVPAPFALIACYAVSFGAALWALRRFCIGAGLSSMLSTVWTLTVALAPTIRPEMLWGVHDEIFALPLLGWSLVLLQQRRWLSSLALVAMCAVAKESFFVLPLFWLALAWMVERPPPRVTVIALIVSGVWLALALMYVFGQPLWSGRDFDHLNKFEWSALWGKEALRGRVLFAAALLLPFLGLPLWSTAGLRWTLPALPFIGLCLLSSDPEMYRPSGYHAAVPAFALGFAGAISLQASQGRWFASPVMVLALLAAQLSYDATSLWLPVRSAQRTQWYPAPVLLRQVPRNLQVAADPAAALALLDHPHVTRLWRAGLSASPPPILIFKPDGWEQPPPELAGRYAVCPYKSQWSALCASQ